MSRFPKAKYFWGAHVLCKRNLEKHFDKQIVKLKIDKIKAYTDKIIR